MVLSLWLVPTVVATSHTDRSTLSTALELAVDVAGRHREPILVVGVARRRPFWEAFAPMSGVITPAEIGYQALADAETYVRVCVEELLTEVPVSHACCSGWTDPSLRRLVIDGGSRTMIVADPDISAFGRRVVRMLSAAVEAQVVFVTGGARERAGAVIEADAVIESVAR